MKTQTYYHDYHCELQLKTCSMKTGFKTEAEAKQVSGNLRPYTCPYCGLIHLTKKLEGFRIRKRVKRYKKK